MRYDIAVVGGGIAGLSVAYGAAKSGKSCVVFDPAPLGGMIRTEQQEGFSLECGPSVLVERKSFRLLLEEFGLERDIVHPIFDDYRQYIWWRGGAHSVPRTLVGALTSKLVPPGIKVTLLPRVIVANVLKPRTEDEAVLTFLARITGERVVREVIDPALKGIYGGDVSRLSARSLFPNLWQHAVSGGSLAGFMKQRARTEGGKPKVCVLRGGNARLSDALTARVRQSALVVPHGVTQFTYDTDGFSIHSEQGITQSRKLVVSTSGRATAKFIPELADTLNELPFAALAVVHVSVPISTRLPEKGFGVLFGEQPGHQVLGVMFNSVLFPHMAPADRHLLTVVVGGRLRQAEIEATDAELEAEVRRVLDSSLAIRELRILRVTRWPYAVPQLEVGHFRYVERLRAFEADHLGLRFIGTDIGGIGVTDRVGIGLSVVE